MGCSSRILVPVALVSHAHHQQNMKAFGVLVFVGLVALINAQSTTRVPLENIDAAKRCNCSAKQTENAEKIIDFMQDKRMADWIVIKPLYCKPATPLAGNKVYC